MSARLLDLRRSARRAAIPLLDVGDVCAADLEAARTNWRERMASEHASARVFGALVGGMMKAGLPAAETTRVADMVRQELDHAELCARVLTSLGAEPIAELADLAPVPEHADASPLEAILRNVISVGCCSETVAVALVATEREQAGPPALRRVLDQILRDEIKHSRFGWRLVDRFAPALSPAERASLDEYLVDAFAHQIRFHAPFLDMPCATDAGLAIGAPHGRSSWLVFVSTMDTIVVPGLARCGLAASEAWREARRPQRAAA
ncbi:MAG TPA: ferritin-like domain-containing protein [Labilithrix sp.]|nr:ferritin-like domain-containing protein [Labilithrix sp.]